MNDETRTNDPVIDQARAWLAQDPDPVTRAELTELTDAAVRGDEAAIADLHDRFDTRLEFGTAGLRGEIAAGPNRMNRVLVTQAAAGLSAFLLERAGSDRDGETPSIVIGYDGRTNSDVFARDTAEIAAGAGLRAILLPRLLPTPVLAFAVRYFNASAGVMVTASHNPPRDNGYKVYLGGADDGSQIVPPVDSEIAAHILTAAAGDITNLPRSDAWITAGEDVVDAYIAATASLAAEPATEKPATDEPAAGSAVESTPASELTVVYTAMHGVGWETASRVFAAAGFPEPHVVAAQIEPDAAFPTVAFPNPEEPGAMDLSFETARAVDADLVIANDPDADRLAIAIPDPGDAAGYRRLSGNEVGALLGWMVGEEAHRRGEHGTLAVSLVSSPALAAVASAYDLDFAETLTGFKWISRAPNLIFGFEEALGYLVNPETVGDKDGISAATLFLALATRLQADDLTVADRLDQFTQRFGHYASGQISVRVSDVSKIAEVMARLRKSPPERIGSAAVESIDDLAGGFDGLPPSDVLRIRLEGASRIIVRPSGTEPKLKVYLDTFSAEGSVAERKTAAEAELAELDAAMRELVG
ncbi:phospho-sugar mutase [Glaciibacter superstes]|uniref:phospho-sugar mutase n=1 Tax=Glaciibacter superstes TaxID=501023 RepID=UPI0003B6C002|nr:phospho-sugar mutase [Glaciibacter superstes]